MAALVLLLTIGMFTAINQYTIAGKAPPPTWNLRLPSSLISARQTFGTFPELSASKFHLANPYLAAGASGAISLNINLESLSAKFTDMGTYQNWHAEASTVDVSISILNIFRTATISCKAITIDANLYDVDSNGVFGTITAKLKGDVIVWIPEIPDSPIPAYSFIGQELRIVITLVEPIYTVTVTPEEFSIGAGCDESPTTVTITPLEAGITNYVNLNFKCEMGGINGWIENSGGGMPPFTSLPVHINVDPHVPGGNYTAYVVAYDYLSGKDFYSNPMNIMITEAGYYVTVNDNNPASLGDITQGNKQEFKVKVMPLTCFSDGIDVRWNTYGDFYDMEIGLSTGLYPPPCEFGMYIDTKGAPAGQYDMDLIIYDNYLNREFICHVNFTIIA